MQTDSAGPLAGVKVLDFGHMVMGPACGLVGSLNPREPRPAASCRNSASLPMTSLNCST